MLLAQYSFIKEKVQFIFFFFLVREPGAGATFHLSPGSRPPLGPDTSFEKTEKKNQKKAKFHLAFAALEPPEISMQLSRYSSDKKGSNLSCVPDIEIDEFFALFSFKFSNSSSSRCFEFSFFQLGALSVFHTHTHTLSLSGRA